MRPITWAAALLALFVTTEAKAQYYTVARPILMASQVHDPCSNCGTYCNGYCSFRAFFAPTVTVNGCPYESSDPCSYSLLDEMACDIHDWMFTRRALRRFGLYSDSACVSCGQSGCGCGQLRGSYCDPCTPWDLTVPPPWRDEDIDPFRDDPMAALGGQVYRISSPELLQPSNRKMSQDRTGLREVSFEQEPSRTRGFEPDLFILTSPYGAKPLSMIIISDRQ